MLRLIYTSTKSITGISTWQHLAWIASHDAFALIGNGSRKLYHDGTCIAIGSMFGTATFQTTPGSQAITDAIYGYAYPVDEITFQPNLNSPYYHWTPSTPGTGCFIDPLEDLLLKPSGSSVQFYRISDKTLLQTITPIPGTSINAICYAGQNRVMVVNHSTGELAIVDYKAREVLLVTAIAPCRLAAFNPNHNVVVAIGTDNKVRVYAYEVLPATLSAPEWYPAVTHVRRLQGYPVRTRLTGDQGEGCSGYWIQWSLLGEPPKGQLEKEYTRTDAEGYATNFYFGPYGAGETGSETLKVSVIV
jgi:hypothetical protein